MRQDAVLLQRGRQSAGWVRLLAAAAAALVFLTPRLAVAQSHRARMAADVQQAIDTHAPGRLRVIVTDPADVIDRLVRQYHLKNVRQLNGRAVLEGTTADLGALAADSQVDSLALDRAVAATATIDTQATGADLVWPGAGPGATGTGVDGTGVGVAVLDSGMSLPPALANQVYYSRDFVGDKGPAHDDYGHGTHVAGIILGESPGAQLINLRVLDDTGTGAVSDVLAALDWAIDHQNQFNIRVVNLSLGHPPAESIEDDPLVQDVERAVASGLVVVAAAGNLGKLDDGTPVIGGIVSPGLAPDALTVGALNTHGTVARSDDDITSWSSRGPVQALGDPSTWIVKPDLVAPGNAILSAASPSSYLWKTYPQLRDESDGKRLALSGTSMAAGFVSGAAALLLQAQPSLTPAQVRFALQVTAQFIPGYGIIEQGAGSLDVALALAFVSGAPIAQTVVIGGETVGAGGFSFNATGAGTLLNGTLVPWLNGGIPGSTFVWGNTIIWGSRDVWGDTIIWGSRDVQGDTIVWGGREN